MPLDWALLDNGWTSVEHRMRSAARAPRTAQGLDINRRIVGRIVFLSPQHADIHVQNEKQGVICVMADDDFCHYRPLEPQKSRNN